MSTRAVAKQRDHAPRGCTQAQGYLFSQPRPVAEVNAMLLRPRARIVA
jgi:EAL domain-containing protein (putative c-di-GMP-specific phosphodiesterase class I)